MTKGRVWRAREFGAPAVVLRLEEEELHDIPEGQLLVRVVAAGIGLPDVLLLRGAYPGVTAPPITPGQEICGEVVDAPPGSRFSPGDRVMGMTPFTSGWGGCGDYAFLREAKTVAAPDCLSDEAAAGFLLPFRTAHAALVERVPLSAGQTLVVLGGAGSSGAAAIQFGKALGAQVIAVAGGKEKVAFCSNAGAHAVVDYRTTEDLGGAIREAAGGSVDIMFDPVGGDHAKEASGALGRGGRLAMVGYAAGSWITLSPLDLVLRNLDLIGVFAGGYTPEEDRRVYDRLVAMAEAGDITTPIGSVTRFEDVPATIASLDRPPPGKSIVRISD